MLRRSQIEKLRTVSIKSELYVHVDDLIEAQKAAEQSEAEAQTEPQRALPRKVEPTKKDEA